MMKNYLNEKLSTGELICFNIIGFTIDNIILPFVAEDYDLRVILVISVTLIVLPHHLFLSVFFYILLNSINNISEILRSNAQSNKESS